MPRRMGRHGIGMNERVFSGVQRFEGNQRFGEGPRAHQRIGLVGHVVGSGLDDRRVQTMTICPEMSVGGSERLSAVGPQHIAFHEISIKK